MSYKKLARFFAEKKASVVRCVANGQNGNLWKAVRVAKDLNQDDIPGNLTLGGIVVEKSSVASSFAKHFSEKIKANVAKTTIDANGVFNGKC